MQFLSSEIFKSVWNRFWRILLFGGIGGVVAIILSTSLTQLGIPPQYHWIAIPIWSAVQAAIDKWWRTYQAVQKAKDAGVVVNEKEDIALFKK